MIRFPGSASFRRRAFTLVEVLVTTSLFSIAMSVLLVGVFSGTRAWDQADRHLERRARIRAALEQFRQDVETSQEASAGNSGLSVDRSGRPVFQAIALETNPGSPWSGAMRQVEWSLLENQDGLTWRRNSQPFIGEAWAGSIETEPMIDEVDALELELRQGESWVAQADPEGPAPELIRLSLETKDGNDYQLVLPLRAGESSAPPGDGEDPDGEDEGEGLENEPNDEIDAADGGEVS